MEEQPIQNDIEAIDREYRARLLNFVRQRADHNDIEDIVNETLLRFWMVFQKGETIGSVSGLLFEIARNLCIDYYRKRSATPYREAMYTLDDPNLPEITDGEDFTDQVDRKVDAAELVNELTMGELTPDQRAVLLLMLRDDNSMSDADMACILGTTEGAVKSLKYRLRENLGKRIGGNGNR